MPRKPREKGERSGRLRPGRVRRSNTSARPITGTALNLLRLARLVSRSQRASTSRSASSSSRASGAGSPFQRRCIVNVRYASGRTPGGWKAHGVYVERESAKGASRAPDDIGRVEQIGMSDGDRLGLGCIDILPEPSRAACDGDRSVEVLFEFIESGCESTELLQVGEGSLDAVALPIEGTVEMALDLAHRAGRDNGFDPALLQVLNNEVGVIALVGDHGFGLAFAQQRDGLGAVVDLAAGQNKAERQAEGVGEQVNFGRQTSSTPPQSGFRSPFFLAVAACWWARTTVESIMT